MERKAVRSNLIVHKKRGANRTGRGFSRKELEKAGVSPTEALRIGLPIDMRRRTSHEENVKLAKHHLKRTPRKRQSKPKKRASQSA